MPHRAFCNDLTFSITYKRITFLLHNTMAETCSYGSYEKASETAFSGVFDSCGDVCATMPRVETSPTRTDVVAVTRPNHVPNFFYVEKRGRMVLKVGTPPYTFAPASQPTSTIELTFIVRNTHGRTVIDLTQATDFLFAYFEYLIGQEVDTVSGPLKVAKASRHNLIECFETNKLPVPAFKVKVVNESRFPAYAIVGHNGVIQRVSRSVGVSRGETVTLYTRPAYPRVEWFVTERV